MPTKKVFKGINRKGKPRRRHKKKELPKVWCDPVVCDDCAYCGEGDFLCMAYEKLVICEWDETDNYLKCGGHIHDR